MIKKAKIVLMQNTFPLIGRLFCIILFFICGLSFGQITVSDSTVIYDDSHSINLVIENKSEPTKIYLTKGAAIIDFSTSSNYTIVYKNDKEVRQNTVKTTKKVAEIIKVKKTFYHKTKIVEKHFLKDSHEKDFYNGQLSALNIGILVNNHQLDYKFGFIDAFSFTQDAFSFGSIKANIYNHSLKDFSHTEFHYTRPPPFNI